MNLYKHEYLLHQVNRLKRKKFEIAIIVPLLYDADLLSVRPHTQYCVGGYLIDLYYPHLNLAIEIDEPHHLKQVENDIKREQAIKELINCDFIRINTQTVQDFNIEREKIKKDILERISIIKASNHFLEWNPSVFELEMAQNEWPNSIFYKIPKTDSNIPSDIFRKPLKISANKLEKADLLVCVYGNTIIDVYSGSFNDWISSDGGFQNVGEEIPNHPLISSGTTKWNITSNKAFGKNLK